MLFDEVLIELLDTGLIFKRIFQGYFSKTWSALFATFERHFLQRKSGFMLGPDIRER